MPEQLTLFDPEGKPLVDQTIKEESSIMKYLIIVRHGKYIDKRIGDNGKRIDEKISDDGIKQMKYLAQQIKDNGAESYHIASSTAPRATDSAEVLAKELGAEVDTVQYLWSGSDAPRDSFFKDRSENSKEKLMNVIDKRRSRAEALLILSHLEICEFLPRFFMRREWKLEGGVEETPTGQKVYIGEIGKGQAVHIDLEQKHYEILG